MNLKFKVRIVKSFSNFSQNFTFGYYLVLAIRSSIIIIIIIIINFYIANGRLLLAALCVLQILIEFYEGDTKLIGLSLSISAL